MNPTFSNLWVCFARPGRDPDTQTLVLSFMAPSAEAAVEDRWRGQLLSGRVVVEEVRPRARAEYVRVMARLGATPFVHGRTLRQALSGPGGYSRWWFLEPTEKDCLWDEDTIYLTLLQLMAVQAVKDRFRIETVRLHGAPQAFAAALGRARMGLVVVLARAIGRGLLRRVALAIDYMRLWRTLRALPAASPAHRQVLLQGYWDWTIRPDGEDTLRDRYFTNLPAQLTACGVSVGWLASCEPSAEPWQRGRARQAVLAASARHHDITLLERYLAPGDIVRTAFDMRYPIRATRFVFNRRFRSSCAVGAFDLHPLLALQILRGIWGATHCRLQLVATATARACRQLRPAVVLTAFELFLRSRALYAGVRAASSSVRVWAAQHAGYSSDKTLGVFDPDLEVHGKPDGCAVPAPDGIFVLGDLSRRIWEANGFAPHLVIPTGGLRFQDVRIEPPRPRSSSGRISVLLAGGMCEAAHFDLCDAVVGAAAGLGSIHIAWRDHPNYRFSERASFRGFRGLIEVTSGTLDDDMRSADLVLFTQTGLGEEALLRGIPTWQWLWPGFNTSPFLDIPVIPAFTSVGELRRALLDFIQDRAPYLPTAETQRRVLHECFGPDPAGASARIAEAVRSMIAADAAATA